MKDLVVRQDLSVEQYSDSWQEMVSILLDQCIIHNPCREYEEENNKKILEVYYKVFSIHGGMTDLDDIIAEITDYNMGIFYKISEIETHHNPDFFNKSHDGHGGYLSESLEDRTANNADSWYESYYYDSFRLLDEYVRILLYQGRMHYLLPKHYEEYRCLDDYSTISVNDCQNTLMDRVEINDIYLEVSIEDYMRNLPDNLNIIDYVNDYNNSFRIFQE